MSGVNALQPQPARSLVAQCASEAPKMRSRAGYRSYGGPGLTRYCSFHYYYYCYLYILMTAVLYRHTQGANVNVTLKGEVSLPHAVLTAVEESTYDVNLKQLHEYLANATGLGASPTDYITARFRVLNSPVTANFSWSKVVDSSLELDLARLRSSNVSTLQVLVVAAAAAAAATASTSDSSIDPTAAVAVIATLASLLFVLLLAVVALAVRAKCRRSSVGMIPALDVVRRGGVGDDCSFAETGTYRMRKYADFGSTGGDLTADSTVARGDEAAIIRAWVQAQLRESHAAQQHQQQQQQMQLQLLHNQQPQQQQQHFQGPKKPSKRFSFRLIGKSMDHFDSGVASTAKSGRSCDGDDTPVASGTIKSVADVNDATLYATIGWTQRAATENPRAPIYRKNQSRRTPAASTSGPAIAAASSVGELCSVSPTDGESSAGERQSDTHAEQTWTDSCGSGQPQPSASSAIAFVVTEVDIDAAVAAAANQLRRVSSVGSAPPVPPRPDARQQEMSEPDDAAADAAAGGAATAATPHPDGDGPLSPHFRSSTLPLPEVNQPVLFRPSEASTSVTSRGGGSPDLEDCRL